MREQLGLSVLEQRVGGENRSGEALSRMNWSSWFLCLSNNNVLDVQWWLEWCSIGLVVNWFDECYSQVAVQFSFILNWPGWSRYFGLVHWDHGRSREWTRMVLLRSYGLIAESCWFPCAGYGETPEVRIHMIRKSSHILAECRHSALREPLVWAWASGLMVDSPRSECSQDLIGAQACLDFVSRASIQYYSRQYSSQALVGASFMCLHRVEYRG